MAQPTKVKPVRRVVTITEINRKNKQDEAKTPYHQVIDDKGDYYSVFGKDIEPRLILDEPNYVMVEEKEVKGKKYRNIVGIAEPDVEPDPEPAEDILDELVPNSPSRPAHNKALSPAPLTTVVNNMADIRAVALTAAVTLAAGGVIAAKDIENQSNTFVQYILVGKDVEHKNSTKPDVDQFNDFIEAA